MNFTLLPVDVKILVIEFLPLDDCLALQQVEGDFFENMSIQKSFWARKVFERYIQYPEKLLITLKYSDAETPYYVPRPAEFNHFNDAKVLWTELTINKGKLTNCLELVGAESDQAASFVERMYNVLSDPPLPLPALKREEHSIPTSSKFENFLTELYFDVCPTISSHDADFRMLKEVCQGVTEVVSQSQKTKFEKEQELKLKKKNQNRSRKARVMLMKAKKSTNIGHQIISSIERREKKYQEKVAEVFCQMQSIIKSHCQIIKNYLLSLTEDKVILKEYKRCWKEFTYSMIEMNALMKPYEDLFKPENGIMSEEFTNIQSASIWKAMVKVWFDQVYNEVGLKVKTSFQNLFMETISQEVQIDDLYLNFERKAESLKAKTADKLSSSVGNKDKEAQEKVLKLLMKSFIALSDISMCKSDFSVFTCRDLSQSQPKLRLLNFLYPNIKGLVEAMVVTFEQEPSKLQRTIKDVQAIFSTVFNEEFGLESILPSSRDTKEDSFSESSDDTCSCCEDNDANETACKKSEIAGSFKLISRCKWEHRLSQIYENMEELAAF